MMLQAWRITKAKHAATAFTGHGAKLYGGRWNSPGVAVVYTASSTSLAILEMLVHLDAPDLLRRYVIFEVTFDGSLVQSVGRAGLPKSWRRSPAPATAKAVGDKWIADGRFAVLELPSAIVPGESNYLFNPLHADFAKIKIGPRRGIDFDPRLIKRAP